MWMNIKIEVDCMHYLQFILSKFKVIYIVFIQNTRN